jgi:antitoxin CcdA
MYDAHMKSAPSRRSLLKGTKVATNVSLRRDLVQRAKTHDINLSRVLEGALEDAIKAHERAAWLAENRDAIETYNTRVAKRGVFSEGWRRF